MRHLSLRGGRWAPDLPSVRDAPNLTKGKNTSQLRRMPLPLNPLHNRSRVRHLLPDAVGMQSDRLSPCPRSGKPVAADPKSSRDHESSFFPPSAYLAPIHKRTGWNTQAYCPLKIALLKTFQKISQSGSPSLGMNRVLAITTLCPWTQSTSDAHPCIQLRPFTRLS